MEQWHCAAEASGYWMLKFNFNGVENYHNVIIISLGATGLQAREVRMLVKKIKSASQLPTVTPILPRPLYQE